MERVNKQHVLMEAEEGMNELKNKAGWKNTFSSNFHSDRSRVC